MKNFLRALAFARPYRGRLLLSVVCALLAATLWSLNFTAIYPVLKILGNEENLQQWADRQVEEIQRTLAIRRTELSRLQADGADGDALARLQAQIDREQTSLTRHEYARHFIHRFVPTDRFQTLAWLIGLVVVAVAIKGFFEFGQESLVGSVTNLTLYDIRNQFYRNVIRLDVGQFGEQGSHELMARFTNDTEILGVGIKTLYGKVVAEPLRALGCVVVACFISWQLTLMFLILVPVAIVLLTKVGRLMKRATRRLLERMSNIYQILQESFHGIRVVKAFTMEPYERRRFRKATRDYYHKSMRVVRIDALSGPIVELLGVAAVALALLGGAYLVLGRQTHLFGLRMTSGPLETETLLQLYALLAAIADPVRKLSSVYTRLQTGTAAADRIFAYMDRRPRIGSPRQAPRLRRHRTSVEFRNVTMSYDPGRPVLRNIDLSFRFDETIALVGKNGCGKTTLVSLLPRFHDPERGAVRIDGQDIREFNLRSLRRQIGLVTQDTILFDDTIHNNIAYGHRHAHPADVEEAARRAFAHDFIMQLPHGYETRVGEAGAKLSGGQRQRLALARAILRDPRILILDEFTSHCDPESETLIHQALREFLRGRTTFLITHRLHTIEMADRVVVMDQGQATAVGTHAELLDGCELYQRLYDAQFQRWCA